MSAIWGCVDLSGAILPDGLCSAMERPLREYKIDRFESVAAKNVVIGCGVQYIKTWSENETLPFYDSERDVYFTADCLIDNRTELIAGLCPGDAHIPDGALMYLAYAKWGEEMVKRVYGSYSYALYEASQNRLIIGANHTAGRSIYYLKAGSRVYFGTLIESINSGKGGKARLNETWAALFLGLKTISNLTNPEDTAFEGVTRVVAGHYNVFTEDGIDKRKYWSPEDVPKIRMKNDDAYKRYFRELFSRCVTETLDGVNGETGILLSSGFDSSAVAAHAAIDLKKKDKDLYAYTHVPVSDYESGYRSRMVKKDESEDVLRFCSKYPNIRPNLLPLPECNGFSRIDDLMKMHETPYKSLVNVDWMDAMSGLAGDDGCRVLMTGQTGNSTISWGAMDTYLHNLIRRGRLLRALLTMNRYARLMKYNRKAYLKGFLKEYLPKRGSAGEAESCLEGTFLNRETARRLGVGDQDKRLIVDPDLLSKRKPFREIRNREFYPVAFAHIADTETKIGLKHGLSMRDVTRDIRVYEFCTGAPIECFVNPEPATRRLARSYLSDFLSTELLPETTPRGLQSGDWHERIMPVWPEVFASIEEFFKSETTGFFDQQAVGAALEQFRDGPEPGRGYDYLRFGAAYIAGLFLASREWETDAETDIVI